MTPLRWTREAPKEAGWWWWLEREGCIPEVVEVSFGCGQHGADEGKIVFHRVEMDGQYGKPRPGMWWSDAPITLPGDHA